MSLLYVCLPKIIVRAGSGRECRNFKQSVKTAIDGIMTPFASLLGQGRIRFATGAGPHSLRYWGRPAFASLLGQVPHSDLQLG